MARTPTWRTYSMVITKHQSFSRSDPRVMKFRRDLSTFADSLRTRGLQFNRVVVEMDGDGMFACFDDEGQATFFSITVIVLDDKKRLLTFGLHLDIGNPNKKDNYGDIFNVNISRKRDQGKGYFADVLTLLQGITEAFDVNELIATAALEWGAYVWIRRGFWPDPSYLIDTDIKCDEDLSKTQIAKWQGMTEEQKRAFVLTDEFRAYKEALCESTWLIRADLTDPKVRAQVFG